MIKEERQHVFRLSGFAEQWPLLLLAIAVLILIAVRIALQSIALDEGDTYVYWVSGKFWRPWQPHANNHLLNSYLIWLFTHLIGLNNFSMRLPSFIGALLYVSAVYRFCVLFVPRLWLRLPLFGCFILNPFVLDFFVAARGYGLALGFFTAATVKMCQILAEHETSLHVAIRRLAGISACLGLSFVANFSFGIVCTASFGLFAVLWTTVEVSRPSQRRLVRDGQLRGYLKLSAGALAPAICVILGLAGWTLIHWPRGQLVAGASSVRESWDTFLEFTFSDLNPRVISPDLIEMFRGWRSGLPWALIALALLQLIFILANRHLWRDRPKAKCNSLAASYLAGVVMVTAILHLAAFYLAGLLLPKDRTSIFFVPLCLMVVGAVAGFPYSTFLARTMRWATVLVLIAGTGYFVGCLRLRYFQLWRFDADMEQTYRKLVEVVGPGHAEQVPCYFLYTSALNYYREYFHDNSFGWFWLNDAPDRAKSTHYSPYPLDRPVYVLTFPQDQAFAAEQNLKVVYRGPVSDVVIAVRSQCADCFGGTSTSAP